MIRLLTLLAFLLGAQTAYAASAVQEAANEFLLNRGLDNMRKTQLGTLISKHKVQVLKATYDYSVSGGSSAASIALKGVDGKDAVLPDNAIIKQVLFDVITAPTSDGSATLAFKAASSGDLKAALAYGSWSGLVAGVPVGTAATMIKLSADKTVYLDVAVAPLTAGKIIAYIEYYLSE